MNDRPLNANHYKILLGIARNSIEYGLTHGQPMKLDAARFDPLLQENRASFVTLKREGKLRGCIGMLEASRPLVEDVAANAYSAAFEDPRFPPLDASEKDGLEIHVSVLSIPRQLSFSDENDLLAQLRPGKDGLILEDGRCRATFLPSVWEQLPDPRSFVAELKRKAGLQPDHWSDTLRAWRYTTEVFGDVF